MAIKEINLGNVTGPKGDSGLPQGTTVSNTYGTSDVNGYTQQYVNKELNKKYDKSGGIINGTVKISANSSNRATLSLVSPTDVPTDFKIGVNGQDMWSITQRDTGDNKLRLYSYSQQSYTPLYADNTNAKVYYGDGEIANQKQVNTLATKVETNATNIGKKISGRKYIPTGTANIEVGGHALTAIGYFTQCQFQLKEGDKVIFKNDDWKEVRFIYFYNLYNVSYCFGEYSDGTKFQKQGGNSANKILTLTSAYGSVLVFD